MMGENVANVMEAEALVSPPFKYQIYIRGVVWVFLVGDLYNCPFISKYIYCKHL